MATAMGFKNIIDVNLVDDSLKDPSTFTLWWMRLSRFVKRTIMRSKRRMNQYFNSIPPLFQRSLALFAVVVGWFTAWMLFIITLSVAFELGVFYGLGMVFLWCTVVAKFIDL